ncbi:MAG TPA: hypothetical protein DEF51_24905 [Myxococcales bacterium]|nr:hypothetical protein [Myxococcales bacterium]
MPRLAPLLSLVVALVSACDPLPSVAPADAAEPAPALEVDEQVPEPGVETSFEGPSDVGEEPVLAPGLRVIRVPGGERVLIPEGFPAVSEDGRFVIAFAQGNDWGDGTLEVQRIHTGRVVHEIDWPQVYDVPHERQGPIDMEGVRRIRRYLTQHGFSTAERLAPSNMEYDDEAGAHRRSFRGPGLEVEVQGTYADDGPLLRVTVRRGEEAPVDFDVEDESIDQVTVLPGDALLLHHGGCGCHCASWPRVHHLDRG